jgi:hypothetical protein
MDMNSCLGRRLRRTIDTRKLNEEGLDMEFNSLDAQPRGFGTQPLRPLFFRAEDIAGAGRAGVSLLKTCCPLC